MYINVIEEVIGELIEEFYPEIEANLKIFKETNFIKHQKMINDMLYNFINSTVLKKDIKSVISNEDNILTIYDIFNKYICYYLFIFIGVIYTDKFESYVNNIVEFTKNQPNFKVKVSNFFNSESNSIIFKTTDLIKRIITILNSDKTKQEQYWKDLDYKESFKFLYDIKSKNEELLEKLKLANLDNNKNLQIHSIIKLIIILEFYEKIDKHNIYLFLEESTKSQGEFIYIDIVLPKTDFIDYNTLEQSLDPKDVEKGLVYEIYDLLKETDEIKKKELTIDEKVLELINKKILIPITEDYLLYHKDSEKYEQFIPRVMTQKFKDKKKSLEDTKIKYIINKIDSAGDLYTESIKNNKKLYEDIKSYFYEPLSHRNAILFNNNEDLNIIYKLQNIGRSAIEGNEFYNDLINIRKYPYINFKEFSKDGFTIKFSDTVSAVRLTSIKKTKSHSDYNMEMRVGSNDMTVNIVGFIYSPINNIFCLKQKDIHEIRTKKNPNGAMTMYNLVKKHIINESKTSPYYWLFDLSKDNIKTSSYEQNQKSDKRMIAKQMVSRFYDKMINVVYSKMMKVMNELSEIDFDTFDLLLKKTGKKYLNFDDSTDIYKKLNKYISYEKYIKGDNSYDKRQDLFPGLFDDVLKLPKYKPNIPSKMYEIKIGPTIPISPDPKMTLIKESNAICQHIITLDNIIVLRKKNPNKFLQLLNEFTYKFVILNPNDITYICKSCSTLIPMTKYISDGMHDSDGNYVTLSSQMQIPLEDIPEYEKYKSSIFAIDKIVDRLASITNMYFLIERSARIKNQIKMGIIKNIIDTVNIHIKNIKIFFKEKTIPKEKYGILKEFSNFWIFELDNSIFVHSSKDKDYFKIIKRNNILVYAIFFALIEMNDSQLALLGGDRLCNYALFEKVGIGLFNGLKIIVNNKGTTEPIQNYMTLCYIIFYITCMITKYNMWQVQDSDIKKFDPKIQKTIIHTLIEYINSLLLVNSTKKNIHFSYNIIATKFFLRLNTHFKDYKIINKIKKLYEIKKNRKNQASNTTIKPISLSYDPLTPTYSQSHLSKWSITKNPNKSARFLIPEIKNTKYEVFYNKNEIINCKNGAFHNWTFNEKNNTITCSKCNINIKDTKNHPIQPTPTTTPSITQPVEKRIKNNEKIAKNDQEYQKIISEFTKDSKKSPINTHIESFINLLSNIIGDTNIGGENIYVNYDTYIIDHDHNGHKLDKSIILINKDNKIKFIQNHDFFKKDVIYYNNFKTNMDIFYDAGNLLLLGYKESGKNYNNSALGGAFIKLNYSILNRIKYLGYKSKFINLQEMKTKTESLLKYETNQELFKHIIKDISKMRIDNLKQVISVFQKNLYRIKYNYVNQNIPYKTFEKEDIDNVNYIEKYKNLNNIKLKTEKERVFNNWKAVIYKTIYTDREIVYNIGIEDQYILIDDIINYDESGNMLLYYLLENFTKLLNYNNEKFVKTNIAYFIIDMINKAHRTYNTDYYKSNFEIKRFLYLLKLKSYEIEAENMLQEDELTKEDIENNIDIMEEMDAIDIEDKLNYQIDYD